MTPESYYQHHVDMYQGYMRIVQLAEALAQHALNIHHNDAVYKSRMAEAAFNKLEAMRWKAKLDKMTKPQPRPDPLMVKPSKPNGRP